MMIYDVPCDVLNEFLALWGIPSFARQPKEEFRMRQIYGEYPALLDDEFLDYRLAAKRRGRDEKDSKERWRGRIMDKPGVTLTARQQNLIADLALIIRYHIYEMLTSKTGEMDSKEIQENLENFCLRFNCRPQEFDEIYDIMHRSGANQE